MGASAAAFSCTLLTEDGSVRHSQHLAQHSPHFHEPLCTILTEGAVLSPGGWARLGVWSDPLSSEHIPVLSGVFTDVEASLKDIRALLEEDELLEQKLQEAVGQAGPSTAVSKAELAEVRREWAKYMEVHEKASFTNSELHRAMNLHVGNLRLLSGPLDQVRAALPTPALTPGERPLSRPCPVGRGVELGISLASLTTAALRGQGSAAEPEAHPGQGAGDAGPACVPGAAAT